MEQNECIWCGCKVNLKKVKDSLLDTEDRVTMCEECKLGFQMLDEAFFNGDDEYE